MMKYENINEALTEVWNKLEEAYDKSALIIDLCERGLNPKRGEDVHHYASNLHTLIGECKEILGL